jgi:hypothetical protein
MAFSLINLFRQYNNSIISNKSYTINNNIKNNNVNNRKFKLNQIVLVFLIIFIINNDLNKQCQVNASIMPYSIDIETISPETIKIKLDKRHIIIGNRKLITQKNIHNQVIKHSLVYEFLGVPFAQPPTDEKRFQFPFGLTDLFPTDVYDATYGRPTCMQELDTSQGEFAGSEMWNAPGKISEDCLHMNIWVPVTIEQDAIFRSESNMFHSNKMNVIKNGFRTDRDKPTLFWIYGGSFNSGSANLALYDSTLLAGLEDVIVVTSNYRTGPFGFLYLNSTFAPGNAGLADQIMTIQW